MHTRMSFSQLSEPISIIRARSAGQVLGSRSGLCTSFAIVLVFQREAWVNDASRPSPS